MPPLAPIAPMQLTDRRESDRRVAVNLETEEMLDAGLNDIVPGAHGTQILARALPLNFIEPGEFPRLYPRGGRSDPTPRKTRANVGLDALEGPSPLESRLPSGAVHTVPGALLPPKPAPSEVVHFGKSTWFVKGWTYEYQFLDADNQWENASWVIPDGYITGNEGWIGLEVRGQLQQPNSATSPFQIIQQPVLSLFSALASDYYISIVGATVRASASYGIMPLAFVARPGVYTAGPLILQRSSSTMPHMPARPLRPHLHFSTWGNRDWD